MLIHDCFPNKSAHDPGQTAAIDFECENPGDQEWRGTARARLMRLCDVLARNEVPVMLAAGAAGQFSIGLKLPDEDRRGYGVEIELLDLAGAVLARSTTALDVYEDWTLAPRYGFLCDFAPDEIDTDSRLAAMARFHLNAAQAYDWMYRHYAFIPPAESFEDALGTRLSLKTVRRKVELAHQLGMKVLAYAAIYGIEPDYFDAHRGEGLFQVDGKPFSLGDFLFIADITHPDWRARFMAECARALEAVNFDGIHLDQYGYPRAARTRAGRRVDLEAALPAFLDEVRATIQDAPMLFNAVNAWPLEAVARAQAQPLYIEIWPPNDTLRDVREVVAQARALRHGRTPVIAAYITELASAEPTARAGALRAFRRLTAAIYLNGGSHIALGENNGALCDPYFPKYARLDGQSVRAVRADYDFVSRYSEYLFEPAWRDVSSTHVGGINEEVRLGLPRFGPNATARSVWTIVRVRDVEGGRELTLGLVNLLDLEHTEWNAVQPPPRPVTDLAVRLQLEDIPASVYWASPDCDGGRPCALPITCAGRFCDFVIPQLDTWGLAIIRLPNRTD